MTDLKELFNAAVDTELGPQRPAPVFVAPGALRVEGSTRAWRMPLLAAVLAAVLTVGTVLAVAQSRDERGAPAAPTGPTGSASPTARSTGSPTESPQPNASYPEATTVPGITVTRATTTDADHARATGGAVAATPARQAFATRFTYSPRSTDSTELLTFSSTGLDDVACPVTSRVHPGFTYSMTCIASLRPGVTGILTMRSSTPQLPTVHAVALHFPATSLVDATASLSENSAASAYPEATTVAGVAVRAATASENKISNGLIEGPNVTASRAGKPMTVHLTVLDTDPLHPTDVLLVTGSDLAAITCPPPFRVHAGFHYGVTCTVTQKPGVAGKISLSHPEIGGSGFSYAMNLPSPLR